MICDWIDVAVADGARCGAACRTLGLSARTVERWRADATPPPDARHGPHRRPAHALTPRERTALLGALPCADLAAARAWVTTFVAWYNTQHLHSAIRFVTPADRHAGRDIARLQARDDVYGCAQQRTPLRWSRRTRDWTPIPAVHLNPDRDVVVATPAGIT